METTAGSCFANVAHVIHPMTPGRFQSQSFNWINRQRLRWHDRLQQAWRSVQITLTWGLQIVLYPVYAAIQSARLILENRNARTGAVLGSSAEGSVDGSIGDGATAGTLMHRRGAASSDVVKLDVVEPDFLEPDFVDLFFQTLSESFAFRPRTPSGGISSTGLSRTGTSSLGTSDLGTSSLSLSPQRQGIASLRVGNEQYPARSLVWVDDRNQIWSIPAVYQQALQYQMLAIVANYSLIPTPPTLKLLPERTQELPPVRWGRRWLNWMQTSPLALSTNLFQEAELQPLALPPAPFPNPLPPQLQIWLQQTSTVQGDAVMRFLDYYLALLEPIPKPTSQATSPQHVSPSVVPNLRTLTPLAPAVSEPIQALPPSPRSASLPAPSLTYLLTEINLDPIDLASDVTIDDPIVHNSEAIEEATLTIDTTMNPAIMDAKAIDLMMDHAPHSSPEPLHQTIALPRADIEVISESLGYEKHLLEQLLHWLDRVMTWLENQLAKLWEKRF